MKYHLIHELFLVLIKGPSIIHVYQSVNNRDKIPSFFILEIVLFFTLLMQRQGGVINHQS